MSMLDAILGSAEASHCAVTDGCQKLSYRDLGDAAAALATRLRKAGVRTLGLYADNSPAWIIADLATLNAGVCCVPLPGFFSDAQLRHAIADSGMDAVLTPADEPRIAAISAVQTETPLLIAGQRWMLLGLEPVKMAVPVGTAKITYTSGTTGSPKGVCLSADTLLTVARSLREATTAHAGDRHLSVLPLSTLLENLAGVYTPLMAGATVCTPAQAEVGMRGAAGLDTPALIAALHRFQATSAILVPQLLLALVFASEQGAPVPRMRFVAVGGAPVAQELLERARRAGWPVYEGYGLSECASVVALSNATHQRAGSVGKILPHLQVRIADDREILVRGSALLGYTGGALQARDWVPTGDLGRLDDDGFLYVDGRKKNMFITAFGRNVAPEWVERELVQHPAVAQAAVFGEGRPWNSAVISARTLPGVNSQAAVAAAITAANRLLPDYAQIRRWIVANQPFSFENDLLTSNGRVRREQVQARYRQQLDSLYLETLA